MSIRRLRHRVGVAICASIAMSCASATMLWAATETPRPAHAAGPPVPPTTHSTRIILLGTGAVFRDDRVRVTAAERSRYTDGVRKYFISGTVIAGRDLLEF